MKDQRAARAQLRELRQAAAQLDLPWARSAPARAIRDKFLRFVMNPIIEYYVARRSDGYDRIATLQQPLILVANHASHIDTPVILQALPRALRRHTAVAAAADYFYRNKLLAAIVSLCFNTVPLDRRGGTGLAKGSSHLDKLLNDGWNLLLYPEGTRRHPNGAGRVHRGAAVLAATHNLTIVPIRITGTAAAMPTGQPWPKRLHGRLLPRRHPIQISFGEPILPEHDAAAMIARVQRFFDDSGHSSTLPAPKTRRRLRRGVGRPPRHA